MREIKFRAWAERTIDLRFDYAYKKSREEYKDIEPSKYNEEQWDKWYLDRDDRLDDLLIEWDNNHDKSESKIKEKVMTTDILVNEKITRPVNYEIIEVMQYIGKKDKNGKEIYEGDILVPDKSCRGSARYIIEWNEEHCCFTSIEDGIDNFIGDINEEIQYNLLSNMKLNVCEVIGNIYENPELIGL